MRRKACQFSTQDTGKQPLHLVDRPGHHQFEPDWKKTRTKTTRWWTAEEDCPSGAIVFLGELGLVCILAIVPLCIRVIVPLCVLAIVPLSVWAIVPLCIWAIVPQCIWAIVPLCLWSLCNCDSGSWALAAL